MVLFITTAVRTSNLRTKESFKDIGLYVDTPEVLNFFKIGVQKLRLRWLIDIGPDLLELKVKILRQRQMIGKNAYLSHGRP
jgi:hypothetical protein